MTKQVKIKPHIGVIAHTKDEARAFIAAAYEAGGTDPAFSKPFTLTRWRDLYDTESITAVHVVPSLQVRAQYDPEIAEQIAQLDYFTGRDFGQRVSDAQEADSVRIMAAAGVIEVDD